MNLGGDLVQTLDEVAPVVGDHRPGLAQLQRKVVQGGQQVGPLFLVSENQAFGLPDLLVALQGLGVLGPQLGDGVVQKPPALRRPGPDQVKVLRQNSTVFRVSPSSEAFFSFTPFRVICRRAWSQRAISTVKSRPRLVISPVRKPC